MSREELPKRRYHESFEFYHGPHKFTAGVGFYGDGRVAEVFLDAGKAGTDLQATARDAAVAVSLCLQFGCPLEMLQGAITRNEDGSAAGAMGALLDRLAHCSVAEAAE